jgi:hypothetical protein
VNDGPNAQHARALSLLAPHVDDIAGGASRHGSVSFISETWRRWFEGTDVTETVDAVLALLGGDAIDRSQIAALAQRADHPEGRARLLLATLMWGRGKSNGRMRSHIVKTVTHPDRDDVLAATQNLAVAGDLAAAYRSWTLPGLNEPFFTKWLWASTLTLPDDEQGLILDGRVWETLGALGWNSLVAAGGTTRRALRYVAYVESARRWAEELSTNTQVVTPQDVEWAMFAANGDLERLPSRD